MLYCYSVFQTILDNKGAAKKRVLRNTVIRSVAPNDFGEKYIRDQELSDMALGRANLTEAITSGARNADRSAIQEYFRANVLPLLKDTEHKLIVLALQKAILEDEEIDDDTIVDLCSNRTKKDFLKGSRFTLPDILAGLFLFAVERNNNYQTNEHVKKINSAFFDSLKGRMSEIQIVLPNEEIDEKEVESFISDARYSLARAKNNRFCPKCGKPIAYVNEDGIEVDETDFVINEGLPVVVCKTCKVALDASPSLLPEVLATQRCVDVEADLVAVSVGNIPTRSDLIAVLEALDDMDENESTRLSGPASIRDKIPDDKGLQKKILNFVTPSYTGVMQILNDLSGQNAINKDRIGEKIHRMWQDMQEKQASKDQIFNALVQAINEKGGRTHKSACETLIAYYIQRCDVFEVPR